MRKSIIIIALATLPLFDSCSLSNNTTADILEEIKDNDTYYYVCNNMGMDSEEEFQPVVYDEVEMLFEKFDVPYELQDYTRSICELQNVDPVVFISLVQIESHWGNGTTGVTTDYNTIVGYRMYGSDKQWTDLGLAQLSTRYAKEQEERYFNPDLIRSLGYFRKFDQKDPYVNLQVGCAYLGFLYRYFGNYEEAVMSYNTGLGNVINGRVPDVTHEYTRAIMNSWKYREGDV